MSAKISILLISDLCVGSHSLLLGPSSCRKGKHSDLLTSRQTDCRVSNPCFQSTLQWAYRWPLQKTLCLQNKLVRRHSHGWSFRQGNVQKHLAPGCFHDGVEMLAISAAAPPQIGVMHAAPVVRCQLHTLNCFHYQKVLAVLRLLFASESNAVIESHCFSGAQSSVMP